MKNESYNDSIDNLSILRMANKYFIQGDAPLLNSLVEEGMRNMKRKQLMLVPRSSEVLLEKIIKVLKDVASEIIEHEEVYGCPSGFIDFFDSFVNDASLTQTCMLRTLKSGVQYQKDIVSELMGCLEGLVKKKIINVDTTKLQSEMMQSYENTTNTWVNHLKNNEHCGCNNFPFPDETKEIISEYFSTMSEEIIAEIIAKYGPLLLE